MDAISIDEINNNLSTEPMEGEIFEDVKGYDGMYSVSNYGRVRSERRYDMPSRVRKEKMRKVYFDKNGCGAIKLWRSNKAQDFLVSQLVADAFIKKSRNSRTIVVMHKNKNPKDNRLANLDVVESYISKKRDIELGVDERIRSARELLLKGVHKCSMCKEILPVNRFHKCKSKVNGIVSSCKECSKRNKKLNQLSSIIKCMPNVESIKKAKSMRDLIKPSEQLSISLLKAKKLSWLTMDV